MDNNLQNINDEIQQVLNDFRFYSAEGSRTNNNTPHFNAIPNNVSDTQLLYMLHEVVNEYNAIIRTNTVNMRRYHDNIGTFIQIINRAHMRTNPRQRNNFYGYYSQNNNSVPNTRFTWRTRSPLDT